MSGYRVGIDVGGTFTDLICTTPSGEVLLDKTPTTPEDQSVGVMRGMELLASRTGHSLAEFCDHLDVVVHGTTTADNTMIEMDGAVTGLLVTEGHRDEIEMRRVHKERIWDPAHPAPAPIARRRARIPIPERLDFEGNVLEPLDEQAVREGVQRLRKLGVESVAVMYLFSFVNPAHERRTREIVLEEMPEVQSITLSHEVMPRGPEFERVSTTLVNAYVAPRIAGYVARLEERLRTAGHRGELLLMQATGGVMPPRHVSRHAVTLLGSGPTGGVMGAARTAALAGAPDFVAVDMGGTSFDVCLVRDGVPEIKADWNWRYRYYIGLPMVDVQCVGAGGGSLARVRQGALLVGPESAGAEPGPACYGRGGDHATVTDADVVLGYLPTTGFAGGTMTLDAEAARGAVERDVAVPLGMDVVDAAWGIERIVNANMANATRRVLAGYGADARELAMIAYGGNGAVHAWAVAEELGVRRVIVPKAAPVFSALGLLVADHRVDIQRSHVQPLSHVDATRLQGLLDELVAEARAELDPTGLPDAAVTVTPYVQMAYGGQNFDMSIEPPASPLTEASLLDLAGAFHDAHEADRGFAFRDQPPVVRGVRVRVVGATPKPPSLGAMGSTTVADATRGTREVHFGSGFVAATVVDGEALAPGAEIEGPALIEERFTVVAVPPGWTARLLESAAYELTRR